jgi:hypothetical protein
MVHGVNVSIAKEQESAPIAKERVLKISVTERRFFTASNF